MRKSKMMIAFNIFLVLCGIALIIMGIVGLVMELEFDSKTQFKDIRLHSKKVLHNTYVIDLGKGESLYHMDFVFADDFKDSVAVKVLIPTNFSGRIPVEYVTVDMTTLTIDRRVIGYHFQLYDL